MRKFYPHDIIVRLRMRFTYCRHNGHMTDPELGDYCYNCGKPIKAG